MGNSYSGSPTPSDQIHIPEPMNLFGSNGYNGTNYPTGGVYSPPSNTGTNGTRTNTNTNTTNTGSTGYQGPVGHGGYSATGPGSSGNMTDAQNQFFAGNTGITDPYQANQNMASTIASYGAQSIPGAAQFQQGLFEPGFNAAENAFLNSEAERQTRLLNGQMAQLGNKFSGTPFHSGYLNTSRELGAEAASNLGQAAQTLALNRQGLAAQAAGRILGNPMQATEQAQNVVPSMLGMISNLQGAPIQAGLSYLNGSPIMSPTIIPGAQTVSGGGGRKK